MADKILRSKMVLDNSQFKKGLKDSQTATQRFGSMVKSIGPMMAGAFSVGAIVNFAKAALSAYSDQIKAEAKLVTALKGRADISDMLIRQANELQGKSLFSDEDIINGQALLATFTQSATQLKALTPLVLDYAQAFGMDVASAAKQVGKALISTNGMLGKTGISAGGAAGSFERFSSVVEVLSDKFKDQAQNAIPEELRKLRESEVAIDEFKESWGGMLVGMAQSLPLDKFKEGMDYVTWRLDKFKEMGGGFGNWWKRFLHIGEFSEEAFNAEQNISDFQDAMSETVEVSTSSAEPLEVVKENFEGIAKATKDAAENISDFEKAMGLEPIKKALPQVFASTMPLNELPGGLKSGAISLPTEDLKEFDIAMRTTMQGMSAFTERYDKFNVDVQQINEAITAAFQQLAMVAVDAFADMVESMVAGGEGMKDIGPKMLAAIGGIMEDLGKQFIVIGALGKLFASAVESMQWYVALGAGIALVAAGAALKGIAQQSVKPQGMAEGGVVPSGFPGDTYPARLTSGEMVIPPHKLDSVMGGRQVVVLETQVRGEDIYFIQKKISSKHDRYT